MRTTFPEPTRLTVLAPSAAPSSTSPSSAPTLAAPSASLNPPSTTPFTGTFVEYVGTILTTLGATPAVSASTRNVPWYAYAASPDSSSAVGSRNTCTKDPFANGALGTNSTARPP